VLGLSLSRPLLPYQNPARGMPLRSILLVKIASLTQSESLFPNVDPIPPPPPYSFSHPDSCWSLLWIDRSRSFCPVAKAFLVSLLPPATQFNLPLFKKVFQPFYHLPLPSHSLIKFPRDYCPHPLILHPRDPQCPHQHPSSRRSDTAYLRLPPVSKLKEHTLGCIVYQKRLSRIFHVRAVSFFGQYTVLPLNGWRRIQFWSSGPFFRVF